MKSRNQENKNREGKRGLNEVMGYFGSMFDRKENKDTLDREKLMGTKISSLGDLKTFIKEVDGKISKFIWRDLVNELDIIVEPLTSLEFAFVGSKFKEIDLRGMDTSRVTSMSHMFNLCENLDRVDLSTLDTRNVEDMGSMFSSCHNLIELDLSSLDTSNVENMSCMFDGCQKLKELDLSNFNTENVEDMRSMFNECKMLSKLNVTSFDTSNITNMSSMFYSCCNLKDLDVSDFSTGKVTNMEHMFGCCSSIRELDLSSFDTKCVENMSAMFVDCENLEDLCLLGFDTSMVRNMSRMFYGCNFLEQLDLSSFNVSRVRDMEGMFYDCDIDVTISEEGKELMQLESNRVKFKMKGVPLVHGSNSGGRHLVVWRIHLVLVVCFNKLGGIKMEIRNLEEFKEFVRKINCERDEFIWRDLVKEFEITIYEPITDLSKLFMSCGFKRIDLWRLDTSKVENMSNMFYDCQSLIDLNLSYLHTESVTDMSSMFESCSNLEVLEIPHFDTRNVKNMSKMFDRCKSLEELDLSSFDTRNVEDMGYMFAWCDCLKKLDKSNFNTENVREMDGMFCYSKSLKELDLSNFNTKNLLIYDGMLEGCNVDVIISERCIELEKLESDNVRIKLLCEYGEVNRGKKDPSFKQIIIKNSMNLGNFIRKIDEECRVFVWKDLVNEFNISIEGDLETFELLFAHTHFEKIDLRGLDTSSVTNMARVFYKCNNLSEINISGLDTSSLTTMCAMFYDCPRLKEIDLSSLDTRNVEDMSELFNMCTGLEYVNLSNLNTKNLKHVYKMFSRCEKLKNIDLSSFDVEISDMELMFNECKRLKNIDLSGFKVGDYVNLSLVFRDCNLEVTISEKGLRLKELETDKVRFTLKGELTVDAEEKLKKVEDRKKELEEENKKYGDMQSILAGLENDSISDPFSSSSLF